MINTLEISMDAINPAGTVSLDQKSPLVDRAAPMAADAAGIGAFVAALLAHTLQPATPASAAEASGTNAVPLTATPASAMAAPPGGTSAAVPMLPDPRQVLAARQQPPANPLHANPALRTVVQSAPTLTVAGTADQGPQLTASLADDSVAAVFQVPDALRVMPSTERDMTAMPRALAADAVMRMVAEPSSQAATPAALEAESPLVQTLNRLGDTAGLQQQFSVGPSSALPVRDPALFAERLNQQVSVMLSQHAQHARLAVNPPDLGPVDVRVTVIGDEATVHLAAAHAATREALEEALPRLRAAFLDSGIALGNAGVFTEMPEHHHDPHRDGGVRPIADQSVPEGGEFEDHSPPLARVRIGLVDAFV
ncbi:MAG: flagellar hook-length control protein FliK [Gammaproteobacteria bacterium]